jgi:hypothetical protein
MTITNVNNGANPTMAAALQEATETAAQTKAEAAKGDRQAIRKMARIQEAQGAESAAPAPAPAAAGVHSRALNVQA